MLGLVLYTLTILAIGTQTRLEDHLGGNTGCLVHTITNILLHGWIVVGGTGMAWFRLISRFGLLSIKPRVEVLPII